MSELENVEVIGVVETTEEIVEEEVKEEIE